LWQVSATDATKQERVQKHTQLRYSKLDTLWVILRTIFPASHLTGAKTRLKSNQNQHKNLNNSYKKTKYVQTKLNIMKLKSGWGIFYAIRPRHASIVLWLWAAINHLFLLGTQWYTAKQMSARHLYHAH